MCITRDVNALGTADDYDQKSNGKNLLKKYYFIEAFLGWTLIAMNLQTLCKAFDNNINLFQS